MRLFMLGFLFLLTACNKADVKPGFDFSVDDYAVLTGGPIAHCRETERSNQYYCVRTQREDFAAVISSGIYEEFDAELYHDFRSMIGSFSHVRMSAPVSFAITPDENTVLILIRSDPISYANFSDHRVILHPVARVDIHNGWFAGEGGYSVDDVWPMLSSECSESLERAGSTIPSDIGSFGSIYWMVPTRCIE